MKWSLIASLLMSLFVVGCTNSEKPEDRFKIMIQAIQNGDRESVKDSFLPQAFTSMRKDMERMGEKDWFVRLSKDFLSQKVVYSKTTWLQVGEHALVHYTLDGQEAESSLAMIYHNGRWWIDLPGSNEVSSREIKPLSFERPGKK